jgi:hypothetical protein
METGDILGWAQAAKAAVDMLKSAYTLLPKGANRDEIEQKIKMAEDILKRSDAKLAKELGMKLCDCTWPPQIMLWKQTANAHVCPNEQCGRTRIRPAPLPRIKQRRRQLLDVSIGARLRPDFRLGRQVADVSLVNPASSAGAGVGSLVCQDPETLQRTPSPLLS